MKRSHRTAAAAAATATLLTGAGIAIASLRGDPPPQGEVGSYTNVPDGSAEDDLDASLAELEAEAKDLKSEIAKRERAAKAARRAAQQAAEQAAREAAREAAEEAAAGADDENASGVQTTLPATDTTTGASGGGEDEDDEDDEEDGDD